MRKEITLTLSDRGADITFKLKEMPATKAEEWVVRALLLVASAGVQDGLEIDIEGGVDKVQEQLKRVGSEKLLKALARIDYDKARPLMDALLTCCYRVDGKSEMRLNADNVDNFIVDVKTLFTLRVEVLKLQFGFFGQGEASPTPVGVTIKRPVKSTAP